MKINIAEKYGERDLDVIPNCKSIAENIDIANENEIDLDLSNCLIGYDATCIIIDKILRLLFEIPGNKTLNIISSYKFTISLVALLLFRGSDYVKDESGANINEETIKFKLGAILKKNNVEVYLTINENKVKYF